MFTPALIKLKETYSESQIDALVMYTGVRDIYSRIDAVSNILYHDFLQASYIESLKFVLSLRKKYDISINIYPSNRKEYNIINFLIGARKKAAVKYLRRNFSNLGFLNNVLTAENDSLHNVEENIKIIENLTGELFDSIPSLVFPLTENDLEFGKQYLFEHRIAENQSVIGIHPGCSTLKNHINRRWEPDKFAALALRILESADSTILIFGGHDEKELKDYIVKKTKSKKVIGVETKNLLQTAAVMSRCKVFISNDSALMHIAAALKLKIVGIIGPTNPAYIRPWQTENKLATLNLECSPCFYYSPKPLKCTRNDTKYKCVRELDVDLVMEKVISFLAG